MPEGNGLSLRPMQGNLPKRKSSCLTGLKCWGTLCSKDDKGPFLPEGAWRAAAAHVTQAAKQEVEALLKHKSLFRDNQADVRSPVTICEKELSSYVGLKYCIAVNSYGSALFLSLKAVGVGSGDKVLGNAMNSIDVPSAINRAEAEFVPIGNTRDLVVDVRELAWKADKTGARFLLLSHIRGHVSELNEIARVCSERGITLVEDCAHSLGVWWDGRHTGHHGLVACISAQTGTLLDAGDGGFVATDDVVIAAAVAAMAGSYNHNFRKVFAAPECQVFKDIDQGRFPNYSLAMPNISATILRFEVEALDRRVSEVNRKYGVVSARFLSKIAGDLSTSVHLHVPQIHPKARPCLNGLHFWADLSPDASAYFLSAACARGVPVKLCFTNCETPKFAQNNLAAYTSVEGSRFMDSPALFQSTALPGQIYEVCIPPQLSDQHCECVADVLVTALAEAFAESPSSKAPAPHSPYRQDELPDPCQGPTGLGGSPQSSSLPFTGYGSAKFASRLEVPATFSAASAGRDLRAPAEVCTARSAAPNYQQPVGGPPSYSVLVHSRPASECGSVSWRPHATGGYKAATLPGAPANLSPSVRVITAAEASRASPLSISAASPLSISAALHEPHIQQGSSISQFLYAGSLGHVSVEGPCLHKAENADAGLKMGSGSTIDAVSPMRSECMQAGWSTSMLSFPKTPTAPFTPYGTPLDRSRVITSGTRNRGSVTIPETQHGPALDAPHHEDSCNIPGTLKKSASRESNLDSAVPLHSPRQLDLMSPFNGVMRMPSATDSYPFLGSYALNDPQPVPAQESDAVSQSKEEVKDFRLPDGDLSCSRGGSALVERKSNASQAADLGPCPGLAKPTLQPHSEDVIVKDAPKSFLKHAAKPTFPEPPQKMTASTDNPRAKWTPLSKNGATRRAFAQKFAASRLGRHRGSCFSHGRAVTPGEPEAASDSDSDDTWSLGSSASSKGGSTKGKSTSWWPWG